MSNDSILTIKYSDDKVGDKEVEDATVHIEQLEEKLFKLTPKEVEYLTQEDFSESYEELERKNVQGQEVYVFGHQVLPDEDFRILKHRRFMHVPTHIHTFLEMNYVYSGTCTQIINGEVVTLTEGQICIIDTEVPHAILQSNKEDIVINILLHKEYFNTTFFSNLSNKGVIIDFILNALSESQRHDQYVIFHSEKNNNIKILIQQIMTEKYDPDLCSESIIYQYLSLLFLELIRVVHYNTSHHFPNQQDHSSIIEILSYIEKNYLTCSLSQLAKIFNFNSNYVSTLIKERTGKSFSEIILDLKLNLVASLLKQSSVSIQEAAENAHFTNMTFFYKKFREKFKTTPNEYRKT